MTFSPKKKIKEEEDILIQIENSKTDIEEVTSIIKNLSQSSLIFLAKHYKITLKEIIPQEDIINYFIDYNIIQDVIYKKKSLTSVTAKEKKNVNEFFAKTKSSSKETEVIIIDTNTIQLESFRKLRVNCKNTKDMLLGDEIINAWGSYLSKNHPTNHYFSSFLFTNEYSYEKAKKHTRDRRKKVYTQIFEDKEKIFIPINMNGNHWILLVVYVKDFVIGYLDSYKDADYDEHAHKYSNMVLTYLCDLVRDKEATTTPHYISSKVEFKEWRDKWQLINLEQISPFQNNLYDCGVFVCANMFYLSNNQELDFSQKDISNMRYKIADTFLKEKEKLEADALRET